MEKRVWLGVTLGLFLFLNSQNAYAQDDRVSYSKLGEEGYIINAPSQENISRKNVRKRLLKNQEEFKAKTAAERKGLSKDEQKLVSEMEKYLKVAELKKSPRLLGPLDDAVVGLTFDFAFNSQNDLFRLASKIFGGGQTGESASLKWYNQLSNVTEKNIQVIDQTINQPINLYAHYIDNQSDYTVIVHHGYRSKYEDGLDAAKMYSDMGYNVLMTETRSHGKSEGKYITFGYYEREDLNKWIELEISEKATQKIILYGVSMGAATVMLAQENTASQVKAVIEDCGYTSAEQQFRDTLRLVTQYLQYIPIYNNYDWYADETQLLNKLNNQYLKPKLKMDLYSFSPLESVKKTGIPKLFIHGEADGFIPKESLDILYAAALGYKEKYTVANADHAQSLSVDPLGYQRKVEAFLNKTKQLTSKPEFVAPDINLLENPNFETSMTGFTGWKTTINQEALADTILSKNAYGEFVMKREKNLDTVTAVPFDTGIRFYNRYLNQVGYVGQEVDMVQGENYQLSFKTKNATAWTWYDWSSAPSVLYGIGTSVNEVALPSNNNEEIEKKLEFRAMRTAKEEVKLGAKMRIHNFLGRDNVHTAIKEVRLINSDNTPPKRIAIEDMTFTQDKVRIIGTAEPNLLVVLMTDNEQNIIETRADENGSFIMEIEAKGGMQLHLVNYDVKGNRSVSIVLKFL
ncbi:serine aminopeptidase domain-containing protein [Vagococcus entomophilus]|uniref:Serine aminopeptidase S33 domain-containing protein n=1 Tax=Vagococcus entomophilus TaxID=1160095 RepID=A0A430AKG6_9ENTE|nr:alpha/beta hydrolase [Vagococcus entomophilus]RSU08601.1 hypothetical protein CBF30_05060 [Vagococcus entomophilus]